MMKYILLSLVSSASAFPLIAQHLPRAGGSISGKGTIPDLAQVLGIFDAKAQYVSTSGEHAWKAPGPNDIRGPCPGLNAAANHGYIPRSGVGLLTDFVGGTGKAFGMSIDLATLLSTYAAVFSGDLVSWSIGGAPPAGLLGIKGDGLSGSHNKYECDVSPTRGDLYQKGDNTDVQMDQWQALFDLQKDVPDAESNYNLELLQQFRSRRFDESIANNPYFFNGVFSGIGVQPAAYTFIYRFMGNKSAEHPEGQLTKSTLMSFFGITQNANGTFEKKFGHERIPENWYKRALGDEYSVAFLALDLNQQALLYPKFLSVGGNLGKPNTFTGVDLGNLTGGVFSAVNLLQGNNAACFAFQAVKEVVPDALVGLVVDVVKGLEKVVDVLANVTKDLDCPKLTAIDQAQFKKYPGYQKHGLKAML